LTIPKQILLTISLILGATDNEFIYKIPQAAWDELDIVFAPDNPQLLTD
jgi:hypothetical protein